MSSLSYGLLFITALALAASGCRKEFRPPEVENELLVPLIHSDLSIDDLVQDSLRSEDSEGLVSIVYRTSLYRNSLGAFNPLETREFEQVAKLQSLDLGTQSAVRDVSLGQVAEASGAAGDFIISQHGNDAVIPPFAGLSYGPLTVDGSNFFETVTLDSGYMDVTIQNNFPTGISNIQFEIRNQSNNALIGQESFANVPQGGMQTKTIDLAGKTVEGLLLGNILNFDIDGSNGQEVPIDTSDKITVTLLVRDTKVNSATAIFPAQNVIELLDTVGLENVQDIRGTKAKAASGFVDMRVVSTVEDTLYFDYLIPEGKKDGVPFTVTEKIPPAPPGESIERQFRFDVSGYTFDLTGQPVINAYNAFYSELYGRIDSTGKLVHLSLQDSILMFVKLSDFIPEYIEGYLGHLDTDVGPDEAPVSIFRSFQAGQLEFEEIGLRVGVRNENGVPFEVDVQSLEGLNAGTGDHQAINLSGLPNPLSIGAAPAPGTPWEGEWEITSAEDDLNKLINVFPNLLRYKMNVQSNPLMDTNNLGQFAIDSNVLDAFVDLEMPLKLHADGLTLLDTLAFDASKVAAPEQVLSGTFYLIGYNGLPLSASVKMTFYNAKFHRLTEIAFKDEMQPASTNASGKAVKEVKSVLEWDFDKSDLDQMLEARYVIVEGVFSSAPGNDAVKIYTSDRLSLTLSAKFNYLYGKK